MRTVKLKAKLQSLSLSSLLSISPSSIVTSTSLRSSSIRLEYFDPEADEYNNSRQLLEDVGCVHDIYPDGTAPAEAEAEAASSSSLLLQAIQHCRRTAFPTDKQNFLNSERDFVLAKTVTDQKKLCAILVQNDDDARNGRITVLGTADLQPKYTYKNRVYTYLPEGTITNVFVRPDQRGKKYGKQLMREGIEQVLVQQLLQKMHEYNTKTHEDNDDDDDDDDDDEAAVPHDAVKLLLEVYTQNQPALDMYLKLGYKPDGPVHETLYKTSQLFKSNLLINLVKIIKWPKIK